MPIYRKPWLHVTISRRRFGGLLAAAGVLAVTGCGGGSGSGGSAAGITITTQPQSVSAAAGEVVQLEVVATESELSYQWSRSGVPVAGATSSRLELVMQAQDDGAQYSVRISRAGVSMLSETVTLQLSAASGLAGIELVAGRLGGRGFLEGRGGEARLTFPLGIARGPGEQWYFATSSHLWHVSADGEARVLLQTNMNEMASDRDGNLYLIGLSSLFRYRRDSNDFEALPATEANSLAYRSLVVDASNRLHAFRGHTIVRVLADGSVQVVAGSDDNDIVDGVGAAAAFTSQAEMAAMPNGNLLVTDQGFLREVTPDGVVTTLPGGPRLAGELGLSSPVATEDLGVWAIDGHAIVRQGIDGSYRVLAGSVDESGYRDGVADAARFDSPVHIAVAADGALLVSDANNEVIRRVHPVSGSTSTVIGAAAQAGQADGVGSEALFELPGAACVDAQGNYYVTNGRRALRKVSPQGVVTTPFEDFPAHGGVAVDAEDNFYGVRDRTIVKVAPDGSETFLAGQSGVVGFSDGVGASASFANPVAMCLDPAGNLLVLDAPTRDIGSQITIPALDLTYGNTVRRITPAGEVSTVIGQAGLIFLNAMGPPPSLREGVLFCQFACDASGNIYVGEYFSSRVRKYSAAGDMLAEWEVPGLAPDPRFDFVDPSARGALAVLPSGEAFVATYDGIRLVSSGSVERVVAGIFRLEAGGLTKRIVGIEILVADTAAEGVRLGPLPGAITDVSALAAAPDGTLLCTSENSVLRIRVDGV